jgi:hypothetical protein
MTNKTLNVLLIEDNEKHLADAQAEAQKRIASGEIAGVDIARHFEQCLDMASAKRYDGIISDIFFPSSERTMNGIASNIFWTVWGQEYCNNHRADYRCGDERREKMFKLVQDGFMDGKELPPAGISVADYAMYKGVPIVLCTDTYHHGIKTQPVHEYAGRTGVTIIDSFGAQDGNASAKDWARAFDVLMNKIKSGQTRPQASKFWTETK